MEKIKQLLHDWWVGFESRHLWIARLIVYFACLAAVVLVCSLLFRYFNLFHTDAGSARYMLSALVQSQAAIVAIVITLTLIAVQLTASSYSPRVIDIFKRNPDMWLLLGCYGFSIFYGFLVLKLVEGAEGEFVSQSAIWSLGPISISFEFSVSLAYWLGAFTFVALFPYMLNIISLLKPESIIKRLEIEITKGKILNLKDDPVRPIMDVIYGSIMKYDLETTRVGLNTVTEQAIGIIDSNSEREISRRFCNRSERVSKLAVSREDEDSTTEVIKNLATFGESTAEKGLESATREAARSLGAIGKAAAELGFEDATREAASSLGDVGNAAAELGFKDATQQVAWSLGDVGNAAAEKGLKIPTGGAARSLGAIGKAAAELGFEDATQQVAWSLGAIGNAAAELGFKDATQQVAWSLGDVGNAAAELGFEDATREAARSLVAIVKAAAELGFEEGAQLVALSLAKLTLFSEEIVKEAIQDYESELKEQDRDAFKKFMEIYKQEVERLGAEGD